VTALLGRPSWRRWDAVNARWFSNPFTGRVEAHRRKRRARGVSLPMRFELQGRRAQRQVAVRLDDLGSGASSQRWSSGTWQTDALRDFRDTVLRPRSWGCLIAAYYAAGPRLCRVLQRCPPLWWITRCLLGCAASVWRRRSASVDHESRVAVALGLLLAVALVVSWQLLRRQRARAERRDRPADLRDADLICVESQFRSKSRWPILARVDRAYRLPSGLVAG
jgi:hypothetical protein